MSGRPPSRRWSGDWAADAEHRPAEPAEVDVLIPTAGRIAELAVTLAGLAAQDDPPFSVIVSDQSEGRPVTAEPAVRAMLRVLKAQGRSTAVLGHLPRRGLAEQRSFLLSRATAPAVLFLDDDVWLEPGTLERMSAALQRSGAGFVGSAPQGLSYLGDRRPHETATFEPWEDRVEPETVREGTPAYARWRLHNAANLAHLAAERRHPHGGGELYRVAWLGACVLYRRDALLDAGGFDFWSELPSVHVGEDVVVQWRVMERAGGAGLLPSGAVHLESPTTLPDRTVEARDALHAPSRGHDAPLTLRGDEAAQPFTAPCVTPSMTQR